MRKTLRILIVSQYFPPEIGAPQNRLLGMAQTLQQEGHEVEVLTAMPNYPEMRVHDGFRGKLFHRHVVNEVSVVRSWIYASPNKSFVRRLANYFSFVFSSLLGALGTKQCDIVYCESPPLFLGISGWLIAVLKRARFVFNISDLWPETAEKLGIVKNQAILGVCYRLEAFLYQRTVLVSGQTQGIVRSISRRYPDVPTIWIPNGVDWHLYEGKSGNPYGSASSKLKTFVYAGVLGYAQGLEVILEAARHLDERTDIRFEIIGDGPERESLQSMADGLGDRVSFVAPMSKGEVIDRITGAYGYIVPLRKLDLFRGAIPSKLFDALALGIPILLGVDGEARELFIEEAGAGIYYEPENGTALAEGILRLADSVALRDTLGEKGRRYARDRFDRRRISRALVERLSSVDR